MQVNPQKCSHIKTAQKDSAMLKPQIHFFTESKLKSSLYKYRHMQLIHHPTGASLRIYFEHQHQVTIRVNAKS